MKSGDLVQPRYSEIWVYENPTLSATGVLIGYRELGVVISTRTNVDMYPYQITANILFSSGKYGWIASTKLKIVEC